MTGAIHLALRFQWTDMRNLIRSVAVMPSEAVFHRWH